MMHPHFVGRIIFLRSVPLDLQSLLDNGGARPNEEAGGGRTRKAITGTRRRTHLPHEVLKLNDTAAIVPFIPSTMPAAGTESKALLQRLITGALRPSEHKQPSQNVVAVDCQMIRVRDGEQSTLALARVSIVDFNGVVLLDTFVSPTLPVVDYRTRIHGIRKPDLDIGQSFVDVKQLVEGLFQGALVVGHSLELHLNALAIEHPSQQLRDTAILGTKVDWGWTPSLKKLVASELQVTIQNDKRSSVEDARAAMAIYRMYQKDWNEPLCLSDAFNPLTRLRSLLSEFGPARRARRGL